jgi:DNA-binding CsgD family transcriptional regulator
MRLRAGRLEFHDPLLKNRLAHMLSELALGAVVASGFVARLSGPNGTRPRRILVSPVTSHTPRTAIAVLVNIFDTHDERAISHQVLRDLYGLTPAQAAVTAYLFEGQSVEQTAQQLRLSVNTVRSHLKQVFTKCRVHSQTELLHLLDLGPHAL